MRKTEKDYNGDLNEKDVIDDKSFWKTVKRIFSDKVNSSGKIKISIWGKKWYWSRKRQDAKSVFF